MENTMVNNFIDNRYALTFSKSKDLLSELLTELCQDYKVINVENYGMSFTISYLLNKKTLFTLKSERGYLTYSLNVKDKTIDLSKFEPLLKDIEVTSEKNIRLLIKVLCMYLKIIT